MAIRTIDLGPVSSYAIAVAQGYAGTEAEWYAHINNVTTAAAAAAQSAADAAGSAAAAAQSVTDVQSAAETAISNIEDAGADQKDAVDDEGAAQVTAVQDAGQDAVDAVLAQQGTSVQAVYDKGTEQVTAVGSAGDTQIAAIAQKGLDVIATIPEDYTRVEQMTNNQQTTKLDLPGTYTKLSLTPTSGVWNFSTGSADTHASRRYIRYEIPSGTAVLGIRGYQFSANQAAYGFYDSLDTLIYASSLDAGTDMASATPVGVPTGATVLYVNIGTGDTRGVWSFDAIDVKTQLDQELRMSNVSINNLTQLVAAMPETAAEPEKADLDNARTGWVYIIGFTPSAADMESILHMPVRSSGTLFTLSRSASYTIAACQFYVSSIGRTFVRAKTTSVWGEWTELSTVSDPPVFHVGPTRDYTSLTALMLELKGDTREKVIMLDPGTYDIFADYIANEVPIPPDDVASDEYDDYCVFLPENTHLLGIGSVTLEFLPTSSQITVGASKTWSPLNLWWGGTTVENITIHCKNCRYAIHDDSHNRCTGFTHVFKNVRIIAEANDTGLGFGSTTGFGFEDNSTYIFEDCHWSAPGGSIFYGHDGSAGGAQIIAKNCVFAGSQSSPGSVRLQTIRDSSYMVAPIVAKFENCAIVGGLWLQKYRDGSYQYFDTLLLHSGDPNQTVDYTDNPYPIAVYE